MKELVQISPEGLEIANAYLRLENIEDVCLELDVSKHEVVTVLQKKEVKKFIDTVYMDTGYRNRNKLSRVLDDMIDSKLEEIEETQIYSKKDLADLLHMAHKMRMDELKILNEERKISTNIRNLTAVQINDGGFGEGNYGKLMQKLFGLAPTLEPAS